MNKTTYYVYAFILAFFVACSSYAQPNQRKLISAQYTKQYVELQLSDGPVRITPLNEGTVEVFYQPKGVGQLPSFALPENPTHFKDTQWNIVEEGYELILPNLRIHIQSKPYKLSYYNNSGLLSEEEVGLFHYETLRGFRFSLNDNEKIMGGGQRVLGMDRRGHRLPLYNKAHYGYNGESKQMYYGLPAIMSDKTYIIAFDNSANGYLDIGHTQTNVLQFEADAGRTSYIFSAGNNYKQLIETFVDATGKQPLPPRWALGNYASRFGYKSQQEVLDTIGLFKEKGFPVDAVVLDLYWFGADIKGHMGNLSWDKANWPEPEKMIKTLSDQGVKTILITEPFILSSSSQWESAVNNKALSKTPSGEPKRFDFYFGNTGLVDVFDENAQDWFWQFYEKLNQQGVAGWWGDLGEPEVHPADALHNFNGAMHTANELHNAYGHTWAKMVYNKQLQSRPNERPFIMMRSGFIGSQRYAMVPWTGDVERSWGGLKTQVELALQMSIFGLAYTHSDLGGFAGGDIFDAPLYIRWLQYGVFQPVYRPHAQDHIAPEPVFHDETTQGMVREYVKLRYRMLPYNYSLSMQNSLSGLPMMRPLFIDYPQQAIERTDAYMWGDAFLVAPIVEQGELSKIVNLPQGFWFNYWTDTIYEGGKSHTIDAPLNELPVMVKAGSFVPMVNDINNTEAYSTKDLHVHYYHHSSVLNNTYVMYDDDGKSPNSLAKKHFQTLSFSAASQIETGKDTSEHRKNSLALRCKLVGNFEGAPYRRKVNFHIHGVTKKPSKVWVDNKPYDVSEQSTKNKKQAIYDANTQSLKVTGILVSDLSVKLKW